MLDAKTLPKTDSSQAPLPSAEDALRDIIRQMYEGTLPLPQFDALPTCSLVSVYGEPNAIGEYHHRAWRGKVILSARFVALESDEVGENRPLCGNMEMEGDEFKTE